MHCFAGNICLRITMKPTLLDLKCVHAVQKCSHVEAVQRNHFWGDRSWTQMLPASSGNEVIFRNLKHSKARKVREPWLVLGCLRVVISWHLWIQRIATACSKSSALHCTESLKTWTTDRISMASMVNLPWLGQPAVGFSASIARFSRGVYQSHCSWFQDAFEKTFLKCQEQLGWSAISIASFLGRTKRKNKKETTIRVTKVLPSPDDVFEVKTTKWAASTWHATAPTAHGLRIQRDQFLLPFFLWRLVNAVRMRSKFPSSHSRTWSAN